MRMRQGRDGCNSFSSAWSCCSTLSWRPSGHLPLPAALPAPPAPTMKSVRRLFVSHTDEAWLPGLLVFWIKIDWAAKLGMRQLCFSKECLWLGSNVCMNLKHSSKLAGKVWMLNWICCIIEARYGTTAEEQTGKVNLACLICELLLVPDLWLQLVTKWFS